MRAIVIATAAFGTVATLAPRLTMMAVVVAFAVFFGQRFGLFGDEITLASTSLASLEPGEGREVELFTLVPRDGIRSIDDPEFVGAETAGLLPSTPVLGVAVRADVRAYPLAVLARHEIVNDIVGGRAVAVTYCPLCLTGIVFERTLDGELLEFGVSGKLLLNDLVMYDRQSNSLWSQILGEGITGRHKGERLTVVDSVQTTWGEWRRQHPSSIVLRSDDLRDPYRGYYTDTDAGVLGSAGADDRLAAKSAVLGVVVGDQVRAYPFALDQRVINDVLGDAPLLVAFGADGVTGLAFDRRAGGRTLRFEGADAGASFDLVDLETGSGWVLLSGEAVSGPLVGAMLTRLPAVRSFWFGWSDFYTQTTVYGVDWP